jgi:hypothetical protein
MTEEQIELGRRAVACKGWRWMDGMLTDEGWRVRPSDLPLGCVALPDLTDPATLGCLLALVREAHGQTTLSPVSRGRRLWCLADFGTTALQGETEAELLVAALEAAPCTTTP